MQKGSHYCLTGCGKRITWRFAICADCESKYGRSPTQWPEWLAYLWRDEQRIRRQNVKVRNHEINFADLPNGVIPDERQDGEIDFHGDAQNDG